jgi:hypothetical protein
MDFDYQPRDVDPIAGIPGSGEAWEPAIQVLVTGPSGSEPVGGIVDMGAALTILPREYLGALVIEVVDECPLFVVGKRIKMPLGHVDLGLKVTRTRYRWGALVAFSHYHPRTLWGQIGFLDHFNATFHTRSRRLHLQVNGPLPDTRYRG